MTVLHLIISFLTVPASVLRAFLEHVLLKWMHVPVEDSSYLQKNELCGHVEHKPVPTLGKSLWFCLIPGLLLFLPGIPMAVFGGLQLFYMGVTLFSLETGSVSAVFIASVILYYLGVCCLCHLFPSYEDALYLAESYAKCGNTAKKVLLCVPVYVIRAGAFLARFGVSVLLAAALTVCLILR